MGLKRDIKYGIHTGTSLTKIVFVISELVAVLIAFLISYGQVIEGNFIEGITSYFEFVVYLVLQQFWVIPLTIIVDWLHKQSEY